MIKMHGLEYTFKDHPNKFSLILYSHGCNLKCHGCHNRLLAGWSYVKKGKEVFKEDNKFYENYDILTNSEIALAVQIDLLDMVIFCGGEFLINSIDEIIKYIKRIKSLNNKILIRIDTNGTFPDKVEELTNSGLVDGFAIDIKGPYNNKERYNQISEIMGVPKKMVEILSPKILKSLEIASKLPNTIFRTVKYDIIEDKEYFKEIKTLSKSFNIPHSFNKFIEI